MRFLHQVFIMLYTEDFSMRHYVGFLQIGSHISSSTAPGLWLAEWLQYRKRSTFPSKEPPAEFSGYGPVKCLNTKKESKEHEYYKWLLFHSCPYGRLAIIHLKMISHSNAYLLWMPRLYVVLKSDYVNLWPHKTMLQGASHTLIFKVLC